MAFFMGFKWVKDQEKIRRRRYGRSNRKSMAPYHSLAERRAYAATCDARRDMRSARPNSDG